MELTKGANAVLGPADHEGLAALVLGLTWDAGPLECDVCALVCGPGSRVLSDEHFIYWGNLATPQREVFLRTQAEPVDLSLDRAQILVDLAGLPPAAERIVVTLSTLVQGATLSALRTMAIRALDPTSGAVLVSYSLGQEFSVETCLIVAEVYRNKGDWKLRAVGQGYHSGLAGLGSDFGVNID